MDKVFIIRASGGQIFAVTTSEEKALEVIDVENRDRPGTNYSYIGIRVVPEDHVWNGHI